MQKLIRCCINEKKLQISASQRGHAASLRPFSFGNAVELCYNNNRNNIQHTLQEKWCLLTRFFLAFTQEHGGYGSV